MKRILPVLILAGFFATTSAIVMAYPKPSVNRVSWQLDIKYGKPARIAVKSPGASAPKAYWYLPITISNNTGDEQNFLPEIDMVDDNGVAHRSDVNTPKDVFEAIKQVEAKKLLVPLTKATGPIHQGADEIVETVAVWPEPLERMGSFSIFITGLSGEAIWFKDGKEVEMKKANWINAKPGTVGEVLRKTLELDYHVPGDEFYQGRDVVLLKKEVWIMR